MAFAGFSENPNLQKRVNIFIALAPVVFQSRTLGILPFIGPFAPRIQKGLSKLGIYNFLPSNIVMKILAENLCRPGRLPRLCKELVLLLGGKPAYSLNEVS